MCVTTWNPLGWRIGVVVSESDPAARGLEARTLSFSLETLIRVVAYSVGIAIGMWSSTATLRENVTSIKKELEMQGKLDELKAARQDEPNAATTRHDRRHEAAAGTAAVRDPRAQGNDFEAAGRAQVTISGERG